MATVLRRPPSSLMWVGEPTGFSEPELEWAEPPHQGDLRSKEGVDSCGKQTQVHIGALPTPSCVPKLVP